MDYCLRGEITAPPHPFCCEEPVLLTFVEKTTLSQLCVPNTFFKIYWPVGPWPYSRTLHPIPLTIFLFSCQQCAVRLTTALQCLWKPGSAMPPGLLSDFVFCHFKGFIYHLQQFLSSLQGFHAINCHQRQVHFFLIHFEVIISFILLFSTLLSVLKERQQSMIQILVLRPQ